MIKFSQEKVLLLHKLITAETGGDPNVRDIALLNSALESAFQTFDGQELYPTKEEKGARIGYALISNHAFVDGNKRIGMYVLLTFLETNGIKIHPTVDDVARVGLAVAAGEMQYEDLLEWIHDNK
ncbi:MAG: type II toxin-antitoxin system death-on-curing family toxin [Clostridia bacterium]|jgi:death-on-curing protein|nr:type II toxin-antitoxin system death-on-curing family toxin [Clostridia bacterium]MBQ4112504.1 type II toxin-antitoxin system death-on-curing family toxin [Clostridia bacterium]